ncbi:CRISPR type III-A/MTUBE-associated protein Csm2 [Xenococcus sp. PCC 7305]|uniref:type III-A CRISPR-associated protein Csm2 n=1 Tax=Xenococcus sp. PCC 7305 TaxID=102125 RepID=UPI0002AC44D1|nr:type III-A CRISPR-associated protein Csm2 [Xenococcus sp. PCC 7305]ELS02934.1 CRISPR type III-A/MTUBE-associated protein Csm2 [Xenococcus sp. PCC 7305]
MELKPPAKTSSSKRSSTGKYQDSVADEIQDVIRNLEKFKNYPIRELVRHSAKFGTYLRTQRLETNQVRKFLDAVNRIKADLTEKEDFREIEAEVVLLKPKLAYAAARQRAAKPLSDVISAAIDKVDSLEDFERLVQFIESIIAYHKAAGGK